MSEPISEVFVALCELAAALGATPLNKSPGCWEHQIDETWWVAINPHKTPRPAGGVTVPPFTALLKFNGWPAGLIDPRSGCIAAGDAANEDSLLAAIRAARGT